MNTRRIYLGCQLTQGAFSGEVIFEVETIEDGKYVGVAPKRDCRNANGAHFAPGELPSERYVEGKLATRLVANGGDVARVALPDGEAVTVRTSQVSERESEVAHVSF